MQLACALLMLLRRFKRRDSKPRPEIKKGYNYLIEEHKPDLSYKIFREFVESGMKGMCISHTFPKKLTDTYGIKGVDMYWLSDWYGASHEFLGIGSDEKTLRPTRLDFEITKEVSNFIKMHGENSIIILEGVETLSLVNAFNKVVSFLITVTDMASANRATFILTMNPEVYDRKERYTLHKIFDHVIPLSE